MSALSVPLRVSLDGRALQPGFREHQGRGIGVYAVELVRALARRNDLALTIWYQPELPLPAEYVPQGVAVRAYPKLWLPARLSERLAQLLTLPAVIRGSDHDVFHVLAHSDAPVVRCPGLVVTVHDVILEVMASLYAPSRPWTYRVARALERRSVAGALAVVADSGVTRDDLVARWGYDSLHVHVAHLGLHPRFVPAASEAREAARARFGLEHPFVLYLGGIDARKNVAGLVRAFARLVQDGTPLELVLAGNVSGAPEFPPLLALARELGVESRLRMLGFVPDESLPALHAAAEVFAFPSLYEGFGFPPLEAMACGTPVVSSDGGSLAEVLGDGALLVPAGDHGALSTALARALREPDLRAELRTRGLARAAAFTWDRTAAATVLAYRDAMARRSSNR